MRLTVSWSLFIALNLIARPPGDIKHHLSNFIPSRSSIQDRKRKRRQFRNSPRSPIHLLYVQFGYLPSSQACPFLLTFLLLLSRPLLSRLSPLSITLSLPRPLLQQSPLPLAQHLGLSVVHALQPVSEARSAERIDGVRPQGGAVEEGAHLDADLPEAHGEAYSKDKIGY